MADPTPSELYEQYLNRLIEDAQRVDADFRNYSTLWSLMDEYLDAINEAAGTFRSIINSLRTSTVVLIHRLFDKQSKVKLTKIIALAENHLDEINWEVKPTRAELSKQREKLKEYAPTLERLRVQRNKAYAHLDNEPVLDPKSFADDTPLDSNDLRGAIDLAFDILQEHNRFINGSDLSMTLRGAENIEHLLLSIRHGAKHRKEALLNR